ncbi:MAG: SAM-dependent methyltransferase, partial [Atribacterota bacterium]
LFICEAHHLSSTKQKIVAFLKQGKKVALITDAGMPGIQDPGQEIISFLEKEGFSVDILPGPSAMIPAVVYSGFSTSGFVFIGFLPRLGRERKNLLEKTLSLPQSLVMYEAPTRILSTLQELICYCGEERQVVLCRELTKIHQEILRGSISDIIGFLSAREVIKGEIVLVLEGTVKREKGLSKEMKKMVRFLREKKLSQKDIVESLSEIFSLKKNQLKDYLEVIEQESKGL